MDDHNHGTHVSGTIGAVGNNGTGVIGVNARVSLMELEFLNSGAPDDERRSCGDRLGGEGEAGRRQPGGTHQLVGRRRLLASAEGRDQPSRRATPHVSGAAALMLSALPVTATLRVTTSPSTPAARYALAVTGSAGALERAATATLQVK
jgi:subtilisin family serine protease